MAQLCFLKGAELLEDVDYNLASLLYLLNPSIEEEESVNPSFNPTDSAAEEEVISDWSDYL